MAQLLRLGGRTLCRAAVTAPSKLLSRLKSAKCSHPGSGQRRSLQDVPDAAALFCFSPMEYRLHTLPQRSGLAGALCISGQSVFSTMDSQGWQTNQATGGE